MFSASIRYLNRPTIIKNVACKYNTRIGDGRCQALTHFIFITILLLYDVTRGSPDDEFQELPRSVQNMTVRC